MKKAIEELERIAAQETIAEQFGQEGSYNDESEHFKKTSPYNAHLDGMHDGEILLARKIIRMLKK